MLVLPHHILYIWTKHIHTLRGAESAAVLSPSGRDPQQRGLRARLELDRCDVNTCRRSVTIRYNTIQHDTTRSQYLFNSKPRPPTPCAADPMASGQPPLSWEGSASSDNPTICAQLPDEVVACLENSRYVRARLSSPTITCSRRAGVRCVSLTGFP